MSFKVQPWDGAVTSARLESQHVAGAQLGAAPTIPVVREVAVAGRPQGR